MEYIVSRLVELRYGVAVLLVVNKACKSQCLRQFFSQMKRILQNRQEK